MNQQAGAKQTGFTLVEVLVVVVIIFYILLWLNRIIINVNYFFINNIWYINLNINNFRYITTMIIFIIINIIN